MTSRLTFFICLRNEYKNKDQISYLIRKIGGNWGDEITTKKGYGYFAKRSIMLKGFISVVKTSDFTIPGAYNIQQLLVYFQSALPLWYYNN